MVLILKSKNNCIFPHKMNICQKLYLFPMHPKLNILHCHTNEFPMSPGRPVCIPRLTVSAILTKMNTDIITNTT